MQAPVAAAALRPHAAEPVQVGVVTGRFDYPLMSEGLVGALGRASAVNLLAIDIVDSALADAVTRHEPRVLVLDECSAENLHFVHAAVTAHPATHLVVLTHPPASAPVFQLIADGATCLSKRAPVAEIVAIVLLSAHGHSVVSRELTPSPLQGAANPSLTRRELDVLAYLERGASDTQIAQALQLSIATVRTHNAHIFQKLGVRRRELMRNMGGR
jgi:DNA-binding NarL/FixJ family response regulator